MKEGISPPKSAILIPAGSVWEHKKTGGIYRIICVGYIEKDLTPCVTYTGNYLSNDEVYWTRPLAEFLDGRFQKL
jgi:hypothetical protein